MTIATMLCDNMCVTPPRVTGGYGRTASESSGEDAQQRFADVLPLAQAALETPADTGTTEEEVPATGQSSGEQVAVETDASPAPSDQEEGETTADTEIAAWLLAGAVPPVMSPQVGTDAPVVPAAQPVPEPAAQVTGASAETVAPESAAVSSEAIARSAMPAEQPVLSSPRAPQAGQVVRASAQAQPAQQQVNPAPQAQEAVSTEPPATAATQANVGAVTVAAPEDGQTTPAAIATKEQAASVPQMKVSTPPAQTLPQDGRTQPPSESGRDLAVDPASEGDGDQPATPKPVLKSDGQAGVAEEKAAQAQVKPQNMNPQATVGAKTALGARKTPQRQVPPPDGGQDRAPERPAATAKNESPKVEAVYSEGKDAAAVGAKETGAVVAEARVSSVDGTGVPASHPVDQTQGQARPDAQQLSGPATASARSPVQSVGDQILDSMQACATRGDRQVLVRLQPPELGTVLVRFQERGDQLTGTLEVSNREAHREIERALPQVIRSLQEAGVQVRRVEVVTSDQSGRGPGGEHLQQDMGAQHQGSGQGREHSQASGQMRWSRDAGDPGGVRRRPVRNEPQTAVPQGRIDLLL